VQRGALGRGGARTLGGGRVWIARRRRREGGETGGARLRSWALVEPRNDAVDVDGGGSRDVLQVRFRQAPIPRAPQPTSAYPLGERAFDSRAAPILPLALFTRIPGLGGVQGLGLRPWVEFESARLRRLRVCT
jgi:hypothetical protein